MSMKLPDYKKIYALLDEASPLDTDCGLLCGAACCQQDASEEEMGMYLLPGEASVHDRNDPWLDWSEDDAEDYDFPESWTGKVDFVCCHGPGSCRRELRPVQCRTFPLAPHLTEDGRLCMIINDMELPYACPLITNYEKLNPQFIINAHKAWKLLIKEQRIRDLVEEDSRYRDSYEHEYVIAYIE